MSNPTKAELLKQNLRENNLQGCIEMLKTATQEDQKDLQFLTLANDVQRALKDHKQALKYAEALLQEHSNKPIGYIRTSQEKLALGCKADAQKNIEAGLNLFPDHPGILTVANQVFRTLEDIPRALAHAQSLHKKHPANPIGFIRAAQDLLSLGQAEKALNTVENGLTHHPENPQLLTAGIDAARRSQQIRQSLNFAKRLLHSCPDNPTGFIRASQDLLKLGQHEKALNTVQDGFTHHPEHPQLLTTAIHAARALAKTEIALNFARALIKAEPNNPTGYINASQELVELGQPEAGLELMEQLQQKRAGDHKYLESIRRLHRFLGDRSKSLEASRILFKTTEETPTELISDLIALHQTQEALAMAQHHNLLSETEALELLNTLDSSQGQPTIKKNIRKSINALGIFPHFKSENFNPSELNQNEHKEKATICVIHTGKCAGESVIESLKKSFAKSQARIIEYHVFDSNNILKNAITATANNNSFHWVVLTRNPVSRWISAFNWDYHLYHLNQYFFCHDQAKKGLSLYSDCLALSRGISEKKDEAIRLSKFNHLAFGHMAMGQAWYLTEDLINHMRPSTTSLIRTESIETDFQQCIQKITSQFSFLEASSIKIIHTKNRFQNRYKAGTFKTISDFNKKEIKALEEHLSDDHHIEKLLLKRFIA